MLTHGLRSLFLSQPAIVSLVPSQIVNRITYPCIFTDDPSGSIKPPWITIHAGSTDPMLTLDLDYSESLKSDDIEIEVVGYSIPSARAISEMIRRFFDDYRGVDAKGNSQATAALLSVYSIANGEIESTSFNVVGCVDGTKAVVCPTFTGAIQVANISQSQALPVYPEVGAAFNGGSANAALSVPAGNTATITQTALLTYTAITAASVNGEPGDCVKAVLWQDESYSYDYPGDGRDTKFHKITTSYQVQSEQGV